MVLAPGSAQGPPTKPGTALRARKLPTSSTDAAAEPGEALSIGASARCAITYPTISATRGTHTTRWLRNATTILRRPTASANATATKPSTTGYSTARSWNRRPAAVASTTKGPDQRLSSCSRCSRAQVARNRKMQIGRYWMATAHHWVGHSASGQNR